MSVATIVRRVVPAVDWLRAYRGADFTPDLIAGLTVAVMLVPQGMAYAMLAGLPPVVGLYASMVPLIVYALLGTSRQLAVGPVAMVSLLVATAVGRIAPAGSGGYLVAAIGLAAMVGVVQLAMGVLRLGFLVRLLSHPVISGFTSAAALIIGFSQLKSLLGVPLGRSHHVHTVVTEAVRRASEINVATVAVGAVAIVALSGLKRWRPKFPGALLVVVIATAAVWAFGLEAAGVRVVGEVPAGLPSLTMPALDVASLTALAPAALIISFVGFMESISVAKAFARKNGYEVDANRELIGLGAANIASAAFGAYPVTGGFSRTAVNAQAGARTGLASIITAVAIGATLLWLTPLFHHLPQAVLGALIVVAVAGLIDIADFRHMLRTKRTDALVASATFVATLSLGIEIGIAVGVVVAKTVAVAERKLS